MLLEQTAGHRRGRVHPLARCCPPTTTRPFKKYPHFVGNYGNAWWKQREEFEAFNGPILMTTNCIVPPKDSYQDRLYTTGAAGYPGCRHIPGGGRGRRRTFPPSSHHAKRCPPPTELETGEICGRLCPRTRCWPWPTRWWKP